MTSRSVRVVRLASIWRQAFAKAVTLAAKLAVQQGLLPAWTALEASCILKKEAVQGLVL
jgi:hypothetical protein